MNCLSNINAILVNCLPVPSKIQCECLKNKCESRSVKNFSVRTTQQMVCICDFPLVCFLEVLRL